MKTILFLDDDIGPLQYLVDIFEMKYNVIPTDNLNAALDKLFDYRINIDLIISDWHLGDDITAQRLFKALKESNVEKYKHIPIIIMSSDEDNKSWVEKQGGAFFRKPAKPSDLMKYVNEKIGE
jgi:DNA-binding NtrC family response regulator